MKYPNIISVLSIRDPGWPQVKTRFGWIEMRPEGYPSFISRCRCAWLVFTGKADALVWPLEDPT